MRVYLDACIVIYLVERHPALEMPIRQRLRLAGRAAPVLCWSDLTRMETRIKPMREGQQDRLAHFEHFYAEPAALRVAITRQTFELATELRATHGLKTPDALHLAAAIGAGCDEFWTNDKRIEHAAGERIAIIAFCE